MKPENKLIILIIIILGVILMGNINMEKQKTEPIQYTLVTVDSNEDIPTPISPEYIMELRSKGLIGKIDRNSKDYDPSFLIK
jgi:hypothetical protein